MRFAWQWLAISSLIIGSVMASAETRPQYGGTVRLMMQAAPSSLDPADRSVPDSVDRRSITDLIFQMLVTVDRSGHSMPLLAESWQAPRGNHRWLFRIRHNIQFQDGSPLTPEAAAASLRFANPTWSVTTEGDAVVIDREVSETEFLAELALPRNAIVKRDAGNKLNGTGPFAIADWQPGKTLSLQANEVCWRGRPFVDGIEIELGRSYRDQMTSLQLGRTDLIEVAPEQVHRSAQAGTTFENSPPIELLALVFSRDAASPEEKAARDALALSIERNSIRDVLLQGAGQPAASILPTWISGYAFVFPITADLQKARQLREQAKNLPAWKLGYDSGNSVDRLIAERVALNARDAGLSLQPASSGSADVKLAEIPVSSSDPWLALDEILGAAGMPAADHKSGSIQDLYAAEQTALATRRIIPLFHLPVSYASRAAFKDWTIRTDGSISLADAWLESTKR